MKKINLILLLVFFITGCQSNIQPTLRGSYQSEIDSEGHIVQFAFQTEDNTFAQYISNREVDTGTYEQINETDYRLISEKQDFVIVLDTDNSFEIVIPKLNQSQPIALENLDEIPTYYSTEFDDVEEHKALLFED